MSFKKTVVLSTWLLSEPAALTTARRLSSARCAWASTPPSTHCIVLGSNGMQPDTKARPLCTTACEYGPIALGAFGVEIVL